MTTTTATKVGPERLSQMGLQEDLGYVDGMALYEFVTDNPINRVDPTGLQTVPASQPTTKIVGNKFGDWFVSAQTNTNLVLGPDGAIQGKGSSAISIMFTPTNKCNSDQIAYLQIFRDTLFDASGKGNFDMNASTRNTREGWSIDRLSGADYGWYGYDNQNPPQPMKGSVEVGSGLETKIVNAALYDKANARTTNYQAEFVALAVSYKTHLIYAALSWGFTVDLKGVVTSLKPANIATAQTDILNAIKAWNDQAAGLTISKNSPNQKPLGDDFKIAE